MLISWADQELQTVRLGDKRLHPRLLDIVETLAQSPQVSLPHAFGTWRRPKPSIASVTATTSPQKPLTPPTIIKPARAGAYPRILAIQDTTDFDFTTHPTTTGLGPINATPPQGVKVHSVLAATDTGVPLGLLLGLLAPYVWARDATKRGQSKDWRKRPLTEKETLAWCFGFCDSQYALPQSCQVIYVCDRQGDFCDLFCAPRAQNSHLLVRAAYDRRVDAQGQKLFATLDAAPLAGVKTLALRGHNLTPRRAVRLSVRFTSVTLQPPSYRKDVAPVRLQALLAQEIDPPPGVKALRWLLLTTCAVESFADAYQMLDWYAHRRLIERYHYVLKSGCHLEELQLATRARLQVALSLYSNVEAAT